MLVITDSGANINLAKQATATMSPIIISNEMTARLPDGIIMDSSHIAKLQLPCQSKRARQIKI